MDNLDIETNQNYEYPVIGIICSEATVNSLKTVLESVARETRASFIVFQDLSLRQQENLTEMLQENTVIPVVEIVNTLEPKSGNIYVVPEHTFLQLDHEVLRLKRYTREEKASECLDQFFTALANKFDHSLTALLVSWSSIDGAWGLKKVKEKGGVAVAAVEQIEISLTDTGASYIDYFTKPSHAADLLEEINSASESIQQQIPENRQLFDGIINLTALKTGTALENYEPKMLQQKISKRMILTRKKSLNGYLTFLKDSQAEQDFLFYEILNNPSLFFNKKTFDLLTEKVFPAILENKNNKELRIWSAGCSTGEEVYSLAIALDEYLEQNRRNEISVKIFATDLSVKNIEKARMGVYTSQDLKYLDEKRIEKYFVKKDNNWHASKIIRDNCVFAVHDLTKDFPFSGIDFISCRNVLNLFNTELQEQVLNSLHYALRPESFLLLGDRDCIQEVQLFETVTPNEKIFIRKNLQSRPLTRNFNSTATSRSISTDLETDAAKENKATASSIAPIKDFRKISAEILAEQYAPAAVLINQQFEIVHFSGDTSPFLQPPAGTPSFNILNMVNHQIRTVLKNAILKARNDKRNQQHKTDIASSKNYITSFEVVYLPQHSELLLVVFDRKSLQNNESIKEFQNSKEKTSVYSDLEQLSEKQQIYLEELQTTNEELLRRTEDLEFLNEQLETVAEELRSNNEELSVTNDELKDRRNELSVLQNLYTSVIKNLKEPLLIVDQNFIVHSANPAFYRYFKINEDKIEGFSIFEGANIQWTSTEFKELVLQKINRREMVEDIEVSFTVGSVVKTCMVYSAVIENEQHQQRIMLTFRDTTELEKTKRQLLDKNEEQLHHTRKLESFTVSASDKLLDPVRKIHMFGQKIADNEKTLTESGRHSLERLLNTSLNLDRLIEDLLLYSRIHFEQKKPKKTDLNQILRKVLNELKSHIKESSAVIEHDELPQLPVIPCQMKLLFKNLISNALQFSDDSSFPVLKIGLRHVKDTSNATTGINTETEYLKISFTDNGRGFSQDYENLVFDPFYKLHRDEKHYGAGLGLALVRQIVLNHHGMIKINSSPGEGTSIHIYLPAAVSFEEQYSPN
ncbi:CheR family methyltransferase [Flavobacterium foetidum]|uniref:CheR family methyltransferase n=1 Tax=Flavobacterium foetidum TaxID=2026681 RepID=UPI0010756B7E|nr:CheR family methyltransferase [Flavobacterium foetidum]KAF2514863.1 PAS domain-containing protein [Flavobacterium foetidum]